ncbi:Dabb family protein [Pseudomonas putida]|uniref:Dabb family protein n=1 Tax=Pseudomonas putida TaxID=303 RepID=UPI00300ED72A
MIRHIVMWRLAGESSEEQRLARERVKRAFEGLRGRIPGLRQIEVGIDRSAVDYACDVVLVADFESQQALDGYATHPEHLRIRQELGSLRTTRHQVDYQRY